MSRNNKRRRQEKQRKQRQRAKRADRAPRWIDVCGLASECMDLGDWSKAREVLEEYDQAHPDQRDILRLLIDVYYEQHEFGRYAETCRRLLEKEPDNLNLHLMFAAGCLSAMRPVSALKAFQHAVEHWPDDPLAGGARDEIARMQPVVDELLKDWPFPQADRIECAVIHEDLLASLSAGDYERVLHLGERLLVRNSQFVPAMNNMAEASFHLGQADKALEMARRVLQQQRSNVHALANFTRYLLLTGRNEEAREYAAQLRAARADDDDQYLKKCEALSFLGDDEGVLAVVAEAVRGGAAKRSTPTSALLYHMVAVASARCGADREAQRYWRKALKVRPGLELAAANLTDAAQPVGERQGAWYYPLNYWIPQRSFADLRRSMMSSAGSKQDEGNQRTLQRFAEAHPEVISLVPALLDRGDGVGREFAFRLALSLQTPELLAALQAFALSQRGPDAMRVEAANRLSMLDVLPPGPTRMWLKGRWQEIEVLGFEITSEPTGPFHSQTVDDWAYEGLQALRRGDGVAAEKLFRKCIEHEGEKPDLLNNLAACYGVQGRIEEMQALARKIHERWPDYFFGQIAMANLASEAGEWEQAERLLESLRRRKKFHTTEFSALAAAYAQLFARRGQIDGARSWLEMWRQVDPDHPELPKSELLCSDKFLPRLRRRLTGRRK